MRVKITNSDSLKSPYIRNMLWKNVAAFALAFFLGAMAAAFAGLRAMWIPTLFVTAYFVGNAAGVVRNAVKGRYVVVRAAAVAREERVNAVRQKRDTYRFIPVDDNGEYLNTHGQYDIYIDIARRKKHVWSFFVGRIYMLVFCTESGQCNEQTLVAVYTQ